MKSNSQALKLTRKKIISLPACSFFSFLNLASNRHGHVKHIHRSSFTLPQLTMTISLLLHTNTNNIIASPKSRNTEKMLWFSEIRRKFGKISCKSVAVLNHSNLIHDGSTKEEDDYRVASFTDKGTGYCQDDESNGKSRKVLTLEDLAAIKIQTCFRGHLARRAFRALKGLVKLQALVRGASVRRQARIAVHCMQAMVRLQVKVRARQLLRNSGDLEILQP